MVKVSSFNGVTKNDLQMNLGSIAPRLSTCDSDLDIDPDAPSMPTDNLAKDMLHFGGSNPIKERFFR